MDNQFLDHANIASLKQLFRSYSREGLISLKHLNLSEQDIPRFPPLSTLSIFISVELLDLHACGIAEFPGALIAKGMPTLVCVDVSGNRLGEVQGVLPLGVLKKLKDLRLEGNPMPFISARVVLLKKLLYPEHLVHLKVVRMYTGTYRQISLPMLYTTRRKPLSLSQLLSRKPKPAPVPRQGTFPMLEFLCGARITLEELESAKPYPDEDIYSSPQHPKPPPPLLRRHLPQLESISRHPCILRKPRIETTPRWLKVEPVLILGTMQDRPKDPPVKGDRSFEGSFMKEEDSMQSSSSESDPEESERHFLPPLFKGKSPLGGTYSPRVEIGSGFQL